MTTKFKFDVEAWLLKESYQLVKSINNCKDNEDFKSRSVGFRERAKMLEKLAGDVKENTGNYSSLHYKFQNMSVNKSVRK